MRTLRTELDFAEAIAARELGDRERAELALRSWPAGRRTPAPTSRSLAPLELVEMRLGDGDVAAARSLFHAGRGAGRARSRRSRRPGAARPGTGSCVALAEDDLAAAERWSGQIDDSFWGPICEARLQLAAGRHADAAEAVRRAEPRCERHLVVRDLVLARATCRRDTHRPLKSVEAAVERAAEHGMLQTVAADGAAGARPRRAGGLAGARRLDGSTPPCARARSDPGLAGSGARRGADQPRARRDAAPPDPAHAPRDRVRAVRLAEHAEVPPAGDLPEARRELASGGGRDRPAAAAPGSRLDVARGRRKTFSSWRSNSSADSTPRSTRRSSARSWSTRRTASGAGGSAGAASSTGRRRSRST